MATMKLKPVRFFGAEFRCKPFECGRQIMYLTLEQTYAGKHKMPLIRRGNCSSIIQIQKIHLSKGSRAGAMSLRIANRQSSQPLAQKIVY